MSVTEEANRLTKGGPVYVAVKSNWFPGPLAEALCARHYELKFVVPGGSDYKSEYIFEVVN